MEEKEIYRYRDMKSMVRGIEMQEFNSSDGSVVFVGQYINETGNAASKPKRIYCVSIRRTEIPSEWHGAVMEDNVRLVTLLGMSKWTVACAALGALRGILYKRCIATGGNRRRERALAKRAAGETSALPVRGVAI